MGWTLDQMYYFLVGSSLFFALIFVLALVGELRGWWDLAGEIAMSMSGVVAILLGAGGILLGASRRQVQHVGHAVLDGNARLRGMDDKLGHVAETLGHVDGKLDKLDKLDIIQAELDDQTGVMDQQLVVLKQLRDGLLDG